LFAIPEEEPAAIEKRITSEKLTEENLSKVGGSSRKSKVQSMKSKKSSKPAWATTEKN
jgi:hypothetical protein